MWMRHASSDGKTAKDDDDYDKKFPGFFLVVSGFLLLLLFAYGASLRKPLGSPPPLGVVLDNRLLAVISTYLVIYSVLLKKK